MKYLYEFIGTFFLVFTIGMTVLEPNGVGLWAPLAIGSVLAVMIYAGGHVSGAHYNPAVSLTIFMRKLISFKEMIGYWIAQCVGAAIASWIVIYFKGESLITPCEPFYLKALLGEFIFTFALCFVVLNVATVSTKAGNSYYGWAIGFTVLAGAYTVGTICNAAFNPAVAIGLSILHLSHWSNIWIFIVANFLGAAAAAGIFNQAHKIKEVK